MITLTTLINGFTKMNRTGSGSLMGASKPPALMATLWKTGKIQTVGFSKQIQDPGKTITRQKTSTVDKQGLPNQ